MSPHSRSGNAPDPPVRRIRELIERAFEELLSEKGFQALTRVGQSSVRVFSGRAEIGVNL